MGILVSKFNIFSFYLLHGKEPLKVMMLGLDAAGKTRLLYKYKNVDLKTTLPTIGFNVETINASTDVKFSIWDVGGGNRIRLLWKHYCNNVSVVTDV
ncbi:ADP-ribosylation factor 4-like [Mytilus trossulus]|uniref:ADP-ribosylation factor 4-like n=1 Tax=Mytilus trossulus TaxID=6551 RepID=UPI003005E2DB